MTSNNVPNRQGEIYGPVITLTVLSVLLVPLRIWARIISKVGLWWDDWVLLAAFVGGVCDSGLTFATTYYGAGKHLPNARGPLTSLLYNLYLVEVFSHLTIGITKVAFVLLYARVFTTTAFRIACWILGGFIIAWQLATWPLLVANCVPLRAIWDPEVHGKCLNIKKFFFAQAIPDVLLDAAVLALPMVLVLRLQMRKTQKAAILAVFGLGIFDMVCSITRLVIFVQLPEDASQDVSWTYVGPIVWSLVEVHIAIICACLITLKPLLTLVMPSRFSLQGASGRYNISAQNTPSTSQPPSKPWSRYAGRGEFERLEDGPGNQVTPGRLEVGRDADTLEDLGNPISTRTAVSALNSSPKRRDEMELDEVMVRRDVEVKQSLKQ